MDLLFATFTAISLLFVSTSCAPATPPLRDACELVRGSSLALNRVAGYASVKARNGSKVVADMVTSLHWMDSKDICSPQTLQRNAEPCMEKMLDVLTSYISEIKRVSTMQKCSAFSRRVQSALDKLYIDMSTCAKSKTGKTHHKDQSDDMTTPVPVWQEMLLCHYVLDRLFSFSILTARVFAVGDPSGHSATLNQSCV